MTIENEQELILQAQQGNTQAFSVLVTEHQQFLYNLALRATSHPQEAQDVVQEAFIRAWRSIKSFRGQSSFRTWLYRITTNLCYDRYPKLQRDRETLSLEVEHYHPVQADHLEQKMDRDQMRELIHQQMQTLPELYRMVLLMRYQKDLSYKEIAEVLEMPMGSVKTAIFRAKNELKEKLCSHQEVMAWIE